MRSLDQAIVVVTSFSHTVALGLCLTTTEAVTRANGVAVTIVVQVSIACTKLTDVLQNVSPKQFTIAVAKGRDLTLAIGVARAALVAVQVSKKVAL